MTHEFKKAAAILPFRHPNRHHPIRHKKHGKKKTKGLKP